jgi:hypothetical protein
MVKLFDMMFSIMLPKALTAISIYPFFVICFTALLYASLLEEVMRAAPMRFRAKAFTRRAFFRFFLRAGVNFQFGCLPPLPLGLPTFLFAMISS